MFQGLVKAALPTFAAAAFMALAATPSPAFTLSAPSLDKPTAASNIEEAYWVRGWGWRRPWGWGYGYRPWGWATVIARGVGATAGAVTVTVTVTVGAARGATVGVRSFRWNGAVI
jgi:hypothetical protein